MKWQPLADELARWSALGKEPRLWLRDDDAIEPTEQLDRLLTKTGEYRIPAVLAVIPKGATESLAERLRGEPRIAVAVHGWAHRNHAPVGEKNQELGAHRPIERVMDELQQGLKTLSALFGSQFRPLLVPPWNRIDPSVVVRLPDIGFHALSTFGHKSLVDEVSGLAQVNSHIDLIDWKGSRGCRDHDALIVEIANELARSRNGNQTPVGILTHHLVHDSAVDRFLDGLFTCLEDTDATWLDADTLLNGSGNTN